MRARLVFVVVVALACSTRGPTEYETQSPKLTQSSGEPTLSTGYLCGHFKMLITIHRTLDRAGASDYHSRCVAVFDRNRQIMSATAFADMATCAGKAATVEAFARCTNTDALLPVAVSNPATPRTGSEQSAEQLYIRAEHLAAEGRWAEAVPVYEQAYYLVPDKHGFAYKIGVAAWNAGNCDTAKEYLEHFLRYAVSGKYADRLALAKRILGEIAITGCATH